MFGKASQPFFAGLFTIALAAAAGAALADTPLTQAFSYQGQLQSSGSPYTGSADLRFTLWPDSTAGPEVGAASVVSNVTITNGLFTATVNANGEFGASALTGSQRWLKIGVRTPHDPTNTQPFIPLSPRQALTAAPYALALGLPYLGTGSTPISPLLVIQNAGYGQAISGQSALGHGVYGRNGAGSGLQPLFGYGTGVWGDTDNGNGIAGTSGTGFGVYGGAAPISGYNPLTGAGVLGDSHDQSGVEGQSYTGAGVYGVSVSGTGVKGLVAGDSGLTDGSGAAVWGTSASADGVFGSSSRSNGIGLLGESSGVNGGGVLGRATSGSGINVGVEGACASPDGLAGLFYGNVTVYGTLTKVAGSFQIDDPIDPANKFLSHSFVESPDMMNIYNGTVTTDGTGYATVTMPDWFEALNQDFRYQLTVIDDANTEDFVQAKVVKEIEHNQFTIRTSCPDAKVSWQVTGIRHDPYAVAHRIPIEREKPAGERGLYINPAEYGLPASRGISTREAGLQPETEPASPAQIAAPKIVTTAEAAGSRPDRLR